MASKPLIKVCGITRTVDAQLAIDLGAFALGFIFYERSPRYIDPLKVRAIIDSLKRSGTVRMVGVFVNAQAEDVRAIAVQSGIDTIQLHGDESAAYCEELSDLRIWKAFRLKSADQFKDLPSFSALPQIEALLFDASVAGQYGGTGHTVDWNLLDQAPRDKPIIVSGGLHPANVEEAWNRFHPFALDLSSGVEESPGLKDSSKLQRLFAMKG